MTTAAEQPVHERIQDATFRQAVDLLDAGDVDGLREHLQRYPHVVRQRVTVADTGYFREPTLLEFVAENPVRHDRLPTNITDIARVILDAGGRADAPSIDKTLSLVCSGRVPREHRVQIPLIDLLCDRGANPDGAMRPALAHGEWDAVDALIRRGARIDLAAAAATGRLQEARDRLAGADPDERHLGLALAAQHGHAGIVTLLLEAGEDPSRYNPPGAHAHSTPLHQAALAGHLDVVRALVERGARVDLRDTVHDGTPRAWADHGGHRDVAAYLEKTGRAAGASAGGGWMTGTTARAVAGVVVGFVAWGFLFFAVGIGIGAVWPEYREAARAMFQENDLSQFRTPLLFANWAVFLGAGLGSGGLAALIGRTRTPALVLALLFLTYMIVNHYILVWDELPAWYNLVVPFVISGTIVLGGRLGSPATGRH